MFVGFKLGGGDATKECGLLKQEIKMAMLDRNGSMPFDAAVAERRPFPKDVNMYTREMKAFTCELHLHMITARNLSGQSKGMLVAYVTHSLVATTHSAAAKYGGVKSGSIQAVSDHEILRRFFLARSSDNLLQIGDGIAPV